MAVEHTIQVRDLRETFLAAELWAASCSCGWSGEERPGSSGQRSAKWDARRHVDEARGQAAQLDHSKR
jgi:hypothetical protein